MSPTTHPSTDERGASAVEYGMLLAGIAVVVMAGVLIFGPDVLHLFTHSCQSIVDNVDGLGTCTP